METTEAKVLTFLLLVVLLFVFVGARLWRHGLAYFMPGETIEDRKIRSINDDAKIRSINDPEWLDQRLNQIRQISWAPQASRASTYSAIALAMLLLASVLLVERQTNGQDGDWLLEGVLAIAAISVVLYGIGLQFWEEAMGTGYDAEQAIWFRTRALLMTSVAWGFLSAALFLAIIVVKTGIGLFVGSVGLVAAIYTLHTKWDKAGRPKRNPPAD